MKFDNHTFHDQGNSHGVVHPKMLRNPVQPINSGIDSNSFLVLTLFALGNHDEQYAEKDVANVGVDVVEVREDSQGMSAEEVVIADVLVSCLICHRLIREHQLNDWESIKDGYSDQIPLVQLGFLVQDHGTFLG